MPMKINHSTVMCNPYSKQLNKMFRCLFVIILLEHGFVLRRTSTVNLAIIPLSHMYFGRSNNFFLRPLFKSLETRFCWEAKIDENEDKILSHYRQYTLKYLKKCNARCKSVKPKQFEVLLNK